MALGSILEGRKGYKKNCKKKYFYFVTFLPKKNCYKYVLDIKVNPPSPLPCCLPNLYETFVKPLMHLFCGFAVVRLHLTDFHKQKRLHPMPRRTNMLVYSFSNSNAKQDTA